MRLGLLCRPCVTLAVGKLRIEIGSSSAGLNVIRGVTTDR